MPQKNSSMFDVQCSIILLPLQPLIKLHKGSVAQLDRATAF